MTFAPIANAQGISTDYIVATNDPIDTTGADFLVLCYSQFTRVGPPSLYDSAGNTWQGPVSVGWGVPADPSGTGNPFYTVAIAMFFCVNPITSSNHTFTVEGNAIFPAHPSFRVAAFSGVSQAQFLGSDWPYDHGSDTAAIVSSAYIFPKPHAGVTTAQIPDILTPTQDGCLVINVIGFLQNASVTPATCDVGTITDQTPTTGGAVAMGGAMSYDIQTTATAIQPTWAWPDADFVVAATVVFRAADGSVGPTPPEPPSARYAVPAIIGCPYTSRAQLLRPDFGNDAGAQAGPAFAKKRRIHWYGAYLYRTRSITFGTDFDASQKPARLATVDGGTEIGNTELLTGIISAPIVDDYSWTGQIAWEQTRPTPGTILAVSGYISTSDK